MGAIRTWQRKLKGKNARGFIDIYPERHRNRDKKKLLRADGVATVNPIFSLRKRKQNEQKLQKFNPISRDYFEAHPKFRSLSKFVSVKQNLEFGRHIVANVDLKLGRKIAYETAFVSVVNRRTRPYCLTCLAEENVLISCDRCSNVMFCSFECKTNNFAHEYECGTNYHCYDFTKDGINIKCAIQMVLEALVTFDGNVEKLYKFMENLVDETNGFRLQQYPANDNGKLSRFRCAMNLQTSQHHNILKYVQNAYEIIMDMPKVKQIFSSDYGQIFLLHLLAHNLAIINRNAFDSSLKDTIGVVIFASFSIFNHSCSPNVVHFVNGNKVVGITGRYIQAGEQMCISYIEYPDKSNRDQRKDKLSGWKFECKCDRCLNPDEITTNQIQCAQKMPFYDLKKKLNKMHEWTTSQGAMMIAYAQYLDVIQCT